MENESDEGGRGNPPRSSRRTSGEVECPLCGKPFPMSKIENHASQCMTSGASEVQNSTKKSETSSSPRKADGYNLKRKRSEDKDTQSSSPSEPIQVSSNLPEALRDSPIGSPKPPVSSDSPSLTNKKSRQEQSQAWNFMGPSRRKGVSGLEKSPLVKLEPTSSTSDALFDKVKSSSANGVNIAKNKSQQDSGIPLAEMMRPAELKEYIGQESVLSNNSFLRNLINQDNFINMILWGPPGCGKTSLANIINKKCRASTKWRYSSLSCCTSGVQEVRAAIQEAKSSLQLRKIRTVLFMDEVHRFNKAQQDIFLPHVESGLLTLVGATTENPSFSLNSALLSRCRVIVLESLNTRSICQIIRRALQKLNITVVTSEERTDNGDSDESLNEELDAILNEDCSPGKVDSQSRLTIRSDAVRWLAEMCGGDARSALNTLQTLVQSHTGTESITVAHAKEALQRSHVSYDRKGDEHYNFASALQKSIRGGDDNAALYWTMRMVKGGEDPKFIARRLVRTAAEDIGIGDPHALSIAVSAMQAVQMLGMPESDVILAECAVYLARANHNPEVYQAMNRVKEHMNKHPGILPPVPLHLRNAPTHLMKNLGYGKGYSYDPSKVRGIKYMPEELEGTNFFAS